MNLIQYLKSKGFNLTSNPATYSSGIWGLRNYTVQGYNYDAFCGGYHRAYDFASYHNAPIPAIWEGVIEEVVKYGNFGCHVTLSSGNKKYQAIYGHLSRNVPVRVGQRVKQGDIIGYQSNTNYNNVYMASHLHLQIQKYGWYEGERNFVCSGINAVNIDVNNVGSVKDNAKPKPVTNHSKPTRNRPRSLSAYFNGYVDNLGAEVRKRKGSQKTGFNWNTKSGYDLPSGSLVYIFEVHDGWGRIYTGNKSGHGSNDWIWLGRLKVNKIFK